MNFILFLLLTLCSSLSGLDAGQSFSRSNIEEDTTQPWAFVFNIMEEPRTVSVKKFKSEKRSDENFPSTACHDNSTGFKWLDMFSLSELKETTSIKRKDLQQILEKIEKRETTSERDRKMSTKKTNGGEENAKLETKIKEQRLNESVEEDYLKEKDEEENEEMDKFIFWLQKLAKEVVCAAKELSDLVHDDDLLTIDNKNATSSERKNERVKRFVQRLKRLSIEVKLAGMKLDSILSHDEDSGKIGLDKLKEFFTTSINNKTQSEKNFEANKTSERTIEAPTNKNKTLPTTENKKLHLIQPMGTRSLDLTIDKIKRLTCLLNHMRNATGNKMEATKLRIKDILKKRFKGLTDGYCRNTTLHPDSSLIWGIECSSSPQPLTKGSLGIIGRILTAFQILIKGEAAIRDMASKMSIEIQQKQTKPISGKGLLKEESHAYHPNRLSSTSREDSWERFWIEMGLEGVFTTVIIKKIEESTDSSRKTNKALNKSLENNKDVFKIDLKKSDYTYSFTKEPFLDDYFFTLTEETTVN